MIQHAGIMAAGVGKRLVNGKHTSKAMFPVNHRPLIDYPLDCLYSAGVENIAIVVRPDDIELIDFLNNDTRFRSISIIENNSRAAIESFLVLNKHFNNNSYIVSTCDVILRCHDLINFIEHSCNINCFDMAILISNHIHDDRPIWVDIDSNNNVLQYGKNIQPTSYVYGNIRIVHQRLCYLLNNISIDEFKHLTDLMTWLVKNGCSIVSYNAEIVGDIDCVEDIIALKKVLDEK